MSFGALGSQFFLGELGVGWEVGAWRTLRSMTDAALERTRPMRSSWLSDRRARSSLIQSVKLDRVGLVKNARRRTLPNTGAVAVVTAPASVAETTTTAARRMDPTRAEIALAMFSIAPVKSSSSGLAATITHGLAMRPAVIRLED